MRQLTVHLALPCHCCPTLFSESSAIRTTRKRRAALEKPRNADDFLERLRTKFDTSAVPGRFFEMPDHFRIGMGVNTEMFAEGLDRIGRALR